MAASIQGCRENLELCSLFAEILILGCYQITKQFGHCTILRSCIPPPTGPPVLECTNPPPPLDAWQFFVIVDIEIGCDLCIEPGETADILTITCNPNATIPTDCAMTTPNGTNVLDINDPFGSAFFAQKKGGAVSVSISSVSHSNYRPLDIDWLGTWTCACNNSEGQAVAYSKVGSCSELCIYTGACADPDNGIGWVYPNFNNEYVHPIYYFNWYPSYYIYSPIIIVYICIHWGEWMEMENVPWHGLSSQPCHFKLLLWSGLNCVHLFSNIYEKSWCLHFLWFTAVLAAIPGSPAYIDMDRRAFVTLNKYTSLVLDCLPFAKRIFGLRDNLFSIQWFKISTGPSEKNGTEEIIDDTTFNNTYLLGNKERLFIANLTISSGRQVGTGAAYRCKVCGSIAPPNPLSCEHTTTLVNTTRELHI